MIEPNVSLVVTFGGLWLLWLGYTWVKYVIMISGILMHLSLILMVVTLLWQLLLKKQLNFYSLQYLKGTISIPKQDPSSFIDFYDALYVLFV